LKDEYTIDELIEIFTQHHEEAKKETRWKAEFSITAALLSICKELKKHENLH